MPEIKADDTSYIKANKSNDRQQESSVSDHDRKTNEMMREISQEKAVCEFYLESTNWDVEDAISMYKNMTDNL